MTTPEYEHASVVAVRWSAWCGECGWTKAATELGELGGLIQWWCGYPRSKSAIPLTFAIRLPDGTEFPCNYRLKDIRAAIDYLRKERS